MEDSSAVKVKHSNRKIVLRNRISFKDKFPISWNNAIEYVPISDFLCLFQDQVKKQPKKIAVSRKNKFITYEKLDIFSDHLAKFLMKKDVKRGNFIGVALTTDISWIISILGIWKAGGVYLPLDPNYPRERLKFIINDSNPNLILTEKKYFSYLSEFTNSEMVDWKCAMGEVKKSKLDYSCNKTNKIHLDDIAYVVYTSGSTGFPKGILISHRSLPNIGWSHREFYPKNFNALISGGICFDASILVVLHSLVNGGHLFLYDFESNRNIPSMRKFIRRNRINYIISVPSLYAKLLNRAHKFKDLLCVSLTGEPLPYSLCVSHSKSAPNAKLLNEYGPTECAIGTTIAEIYLPKEKKISPCSVGKPLINTQVFVLDDNLTILPIGDIGEICIAGVGLATGYLNNSQLTEEKFTTIFIEGRSILRIYKTGDIGRFLPNGELEFLGRKENSINFNGSNINLGEIEHVLFQHPEVINAMVTTHEANSKTQIISYFVGKSKKEISKILLKYLIKKLPKFMIPSKLIQLNRFPLSPNGKIDRDALILTTVHK